MVGILSRRVCHSADRRATLSQSATCLTGVVTGDGDHRGGHGKAYTRRADSSRGCPSTASKHLPYGHSIHRIDTTDTSKLTGVQQRCVAAALCVWHRRRERRATTNMHCAVSWFAAAAHGPIMIQRAAGWPIPQPRPPGPRYDCMTPSPRVHRPNRHPQSLSMCPHAQRPRSPPNQQQNANPSGAPQPIPAHPT